MLHHRTFGSLAREWRGARTQTDAGKALGIAQSTLAKIELDQRRPTTRIIGRMAEVYGLDDLEVAFGVRLACGEMSAGDECDDE